MSENSKKRFGQSILGKAVRSISSYRASNGFFTSITFLILLLVYFSLLLIPTIGFKNLAPITAQRISYSLGFIVIVILSSSISAVGKRSEEALKKLNELEEITELLQAKLYIEENYEDDLQEGEFLTDYNGDVDKILGYVDEDEDYEG